MTNDATFNPSDLPIMDGKIYHLQLKPEEMARDIIIVGDPDRVPFIADEYFAEKEVDVNHRGLRTITGITKDGSQRVSIITSGMGTLGYKAGTICPAIANRRENTFAADYSRNVRDATKAALQALHMLRNKVNH